MLVELSVVEQRYMAVREVLDTGAPIKDVATRHGVSRQSIHRWLVRYANGGLGALTDKSCRPDTHTPSYNFAKLHHWLFGESHWVRAQMGTPMPMKSSDYCGGPDTP